jgi:predicted lipid-binding transport protein (Tim44 family)
MLAVLLAAGPVFAAWDKASTIGLACICMLTLPFWGIWLPWYLFSQFFSEASRGHAREKDEEELLKERPHKQQVMFKGEKVPDWKITARVKATKAMLKFLSYTDNWFERKYLADVADEAFRLVKQAIEEGTIEGIERRVTPEHLEELRTEVKRMRKEHEVHVFDRVEVTDVDIVHVEAPPGKENHTFTALVSARSKDFVEDDETGELVRGDRRTYAYQEFWTFRRSEKRWLVELTRPTTDVDAVLAAKNVLAQIDLEEFAKDADPEFLKEVVAR